MNRLLNTGILFLSFSLILISNCVAQVVGENPAALSEYKFSKTASGIELALIYKGSGKTLKVGDLVKVHLVGSLSDGTEFFSSYKRNKAATAVIGIGSLIPGLDEGLQQLTVRSKAIIKIPAELGYGEQGYGKSVPPGSNLIFQVEVLEVLENPNPVIPFNVLGKDTLRAKNGIKYMYAKKTELNLASNGDSVWVNYIGYLPEGKIFDTSLASGTPFAFKLGDQNIIKGWNRGIALMREGEKVRFIIPWKLAYGREGFSPRIQPKTDLTFDIELVKVKK
jgi:FKBP-type peptidyl-prolyl cis-trans isomerase